MKSKSRIRVGVIFGGRSAEHEVSLVSAASVINALDKDKYEIVPIGIAPEGKWLSSALALEYLKQGKKLNNESAKILLPDPGVTGLVEYGSGHHISQPKPLDVVFPVLHGSFGEDGTVQGLFELAGIPYVGAGVLGSAVGMDKVVAKQLCERQDIPVVPYVSFLSKEFGSRRRQIILSIEKSLRYPCFVKPANSGSSVGISKAHNRIELLMAVDLASKYDRKILVEKSVEHAREIEVSVLGNDEPIASVPGEIISSNEFYDYDAKYVDGKSRSIIPARLPRRVVKKLQDFAVRCFRTTECAGMARVDFLVAKKSNNVFFSEINTIPGFTSISMYPKLWEASGIPFHKLLDKLILLAIERHRETSLLKRTYQPKLQWYK